jgi:formate dehydrogenase subunit gamma
MGANAALNPLAGRSEFWRKCMAATPTIANLNVRIDAFVAAHAGREGPLLPILHDVQAEFGFVPREAIPLIAKALNLTRAEVFGVVSFYHDFRETPAGRHVIKFCRAEACQSAGGNGLADRLKAALDVDWGGTSADGAITLEPVYCLGLCAVAPALSRDGDVHGRLDADRLNALVAGCRK